MITYEVLRLLERRCPNYHTCSPKFIKGTFSICPCAACENSLTKSTEQNGKQKIQYFCGRVHEDLKKMGREGLALVSVYGTCDAAKFVPERYDTFKLEGEVLETKLAELETELAESETTTTENETKEGELK